MAGLQIPKKSNFKPVWWGIGIVVLGLIGGGGYFAYNFYTGGSSDALPVNIPVAGITGPDIDEKPLSDSAIDSYTTEPLQPAFVSIPAIGLDKARVKQVTLNKSRVLDFPKSLYDAGWFPESAQPGQGYGEVVLAGNNFGTKSPTAKGSFYKLDTIKTGDKISVTRGDGKTFTYSVTQVNTVSYLDFLKTGMQDIVRPISDTQEGLSLVTYAGKWIPRDKYYDKRIIVKALADFSRPATDDRTTP